MGPVKNKAILFKICFILHMLILVLLVHPTLATNGYRIALVIGNGDYDISPLSAPPHDAQLIYNTLDKLGFEVMGYVDVDQKQMKDHIRNFGKQLESSKSSVGLFYYSGHGMQVDGRNYMIPVGDTIENESDVSINGVDVNEVLIRMKHAGNQMNLVILDACRDNRFEKSFKSTSTGLIRMDAPRGTIIAYAAEPNNVAIQPLDGYSYFTEALSREIVKPGISAIDMLRKVRTEVLEMTNGKQLPMVEDKSLEKFYFMGGASSTSYQPEERNTFKKPTEKETVEEMASYVNHLKEFRSKIENTKTQIDLAFLSGKYKKYVVDKSDAIHIRNTPQKDMDLYFKYQLLSLEASKINEEIDELLYLKKKALKY